MARWTVLVPVFCFISVFIVTGCSSGNHNPFDPLCSTEISGVNSLRNSTQTHLWGYYDLYFDLDACTVEAEPNRGVMFTANVTQFVNQPVTNLAFSIYGTPIGADYVDVDLDVSVTHPFANMSQYNGYDVRGVMIGNAGEILDYGNNLRYAVKNGSDQVMYDYDETSGDPYDAGTGHPDGYTRWFNPSEFPAHGLFGYTPGVYATPGYTGNATLNPYKYFADGLDADGDLWDFLISTGDNGVFRSGSTNTRNYYLRFPVPSPNVKYNYAIIASWEPLPAEPPHNCPEAVALSVDVTPDLWWESASDWGGDFIADLDVFGWSEQPDSIIIESPIHSDIVSFEPASVASGGGTNYSTYSLEFTPDNITGSSNEMDHEYWVILEYSGYDYGSELSPPGSYPEEPLAAFFRQDLYIAGGFTHSDPDCGLEVVTPMPHTGNGHIEFDITGTVYHDGAEFDYAEWDFDGDSVYGDAYDEGTEQQPIYYFGSDYVGQVCVMIYDTLGGSVHCCVDVDVTIEGLWSESFDDNADGWTFAYLNYNGTCGHDVAGWTDNDPFGPSGAGNIRYPQSGMGGYNVSDGWMVTCVSPPFDIPAGTDQYYLQIYGCVCIGYSTDMFFNCNWKIAPGDSVGLSPFINANPATVPTGGAILDIYDNVAQSWSPPSSTVYLSSGHPLYDPVAGSRQLGWYSSQGGGNPGELPSNLAEYMDLTIPTSFNGQTVKIAWQWCPDWCDYGGPTYFAFDDFQLWTE